VGGHSSFLHQGADTESECFALCTKTARCKYVTWHQDDKSHWCFNAEFCNATNTFDGHGPGQPPPAEMAVTHTWIKSPSTEEARDTIHTAPKAPAKVTASFAGVRELASLSSPWYHLRTIFVISVAQKSGLNEMYLVWPVVPWR
jgi:hypothetical protein